MSNQTCQNDVRYVKKYAKEFSIIYKKGYPRDVQHVCQIDVYHRCQKRCKELLRIYEKVVKQLQNVKKDICQNDVKKILLICQKDIKTWKGCQNDVINTYKNSKEHSKIRMRKNI